MHAWNGTAYLSQLCGHRTCLVLGESAVKGMGMHSFSPLSWTCGQHCGKLASAAQTSAAICTDQHAIRSHRSICFVDVRDHSQLHIALVHTTTDCAAWLYRCLSASRRHNQPVFLKLVTDHSAQDVSSHCCQKTVYPLAEVWGVDRQRFQQTYQNTKDRLWTAIVISATTCRSNPQHQAYHTKQSNVI